jgi:predicted amidophosphoribosyltransferase
MKLHPQGIKGPWKTGVVLDWHTISSQMIGYNEFGHPIFDSTRSEIGELLYKFKYHNDQNALRNILDVTIEYLGDKIAGKVDLVIPVPPSSRGRTVTKQIAQGLANGLQVEFSGTALTKRKDTKELKSVADPEIRREILDSAFKVNKMDIDGKSVLLVDDLYRSGATLAAAAQAVTDQGGAKTVYVLAITRTRVHR